MQIPTCLVNIFEEDQKVYSEAESKNFVYRVGEELFSNKAVADKYKKLCEINGALGGGRDSYTGKKIQIDKISETKIDKDLARIAKDKEKFHKSK